MTYDENATAPGYLFFTPNSPGMTNFTAGPHIYNQNGVCCTFSQNSQSLTEFSNFYGAVKKSSHQTIKRLMRRLSPTITSRILSLPSFRVLPEAAREAEVLEA